MMLQKIEWSAYKALADENDELKARVRELEARVERDAEVREAAEDVLTILTFQGNRHRRVDDLRAALAAREG